LRLTFKDVGQGDSIFLEWEKDGSQCYGIIDCNVYNGTIPILDELKARSVRRINFILLTHMHFDHYSGMGYLLDYLIENGIQVDYFYHTFAQDYLFIFDRSNLSQKVKEATLLFINKLEEALQKNFIRDIIGSVDHHCMPYELFGTVQMKVLAPNGRDYYEFSQNRIQGKQVDPNRIATIVLISNGSEGILLTSDAAGKSFKRITGKVTIPMAMVQVPHHGSPANLYPEFWNPLTKKLECPAVFSVGDVRKDKLPKFEVVDFFEKEGYYNTSTNYVYGIKEYYPSAVPVPLHSSYTPMARRNISSLRPFAISVKIPRPASLSRFVGDKSFTFF
jgi:beta-lactamase superfamily II metal-dependent hydrolase